MNHPMLLRADILLDLPAAQEDRRPRVAEPVSAPTYRSEAFAEDLPAWPVACAPVAHPPGRPLATLALVLAPLLLVLAGAGLAVFA
jgi:hypothetical protein